MDLIHFLLSLFLGLFPNVLKYASSPSYSSSRHRTRGSQIGRNTREYVFGHRRIGWYCVTIEVIHDNWLPYRVIDVSSWIAEKSNVKPKPKPKPIFPIAIVPNPVEKTGDDTSHSDRNTRT